jgi:hypothetical protein
MRPKKSSGVETMMEKYLEMRTKQVEDERSQLCKEKEVAKGDDFSIKRCVSVLNTMDVTTRKTIYYNTLDSLLVSAGNNSRY